MQADVQAVDNDGIGALYYAIRSAMRRRRWPSMQPWRTDPAVGTECQKVGGYHSLFVLPDTRDPGRLR